MAGILSIPPPITVLLLLLLLLSSEAFALRAWREPTLTTAKLNPSGAPAPSLLTESKRYEGSSDLVKLRYHMGPVLTNFINVHLIWYGSWSRPSQQIIRDFIVSLSSESNPAGGKKPATSTVSNWWRTVQLYTDQTGSNVSSSVRISGEFHDYRYSNGKSLTRLSVQYVIRNAVTSSRGALPIDPKNGIYLVLTSPDVQMQDFCRAVCGFHYFTFPSIVGYTLPYAWVGNSATQCPDTCAFPFALPAYMSGKTVALRPPNGDVAVDGMISVIGHEIAELSSNPLINAWYAGEDPTAPTEIADLCEGVYGTGGGGAYIGQVLTDGAGRQYNMVGKGGRRFLVQWLWSPVVNSCVGPNALD
ncbi:protein EXORDIUM-like 5 [Nymphaea colorata]|nr:protein EXORDIUM-like 5 [Nymphaea colorata]